MTVAVAHQVSSTSRIALAEAAREAVMRETDLAVLHVVESLDLDIAAANRSGISDEVERVLGEQGLDVSWELHLATGEENVASAILALVDDVDAEILVIGARRRSPWQVPARQRHPDPDPAGRRARVRGEGQGLTVV